MNKQDDTEQTNDAGILVKAGLSVMMIAGFTLLIVTPPVVWAFWPQDHDKKWILWGLAAGVGYGSAFALPAVLYWRRNISSSKGVRS